MNFVVRGISRASRSPAGHTNATWVAALAYAQGTIAVKLRDYLLVYQRREEGCERSGYTATHGDACYMSFLPAFS
jgi:hypothetical protein